MSTPILDLTNTYAPGDALPAADVIALANNLEWVASGYLAKSVAGSSDVTLTEAEYENSVLKLTGTLTGNISLLVPAHAGRRWVVWNATSGSYTITVKPSGASGIVVTQGYTAHLYCDGTDIKRVGDTLGGTTILAGPVASPVATAQDLTNSATITLPTGGKTKRITAAGGAVTGIILTAGTVDGQELTLINVEASNSITFAAAGTSNVADGTSAVLAAARSMALVWDSVSSKWYRS